MTIKKFIQWRDKIFETKDISPLWFGMTQEEVISEFGEPDTTSNEIRNGCPLIFKYHDIEFHFDERHNYTLFLVFSEEIESLSIMTLGFPSMSKEQVALLRAESMTGHVLDNNFKIYNRSKGGEIYTVFNSLDLAKQYIEEQKIQHQGVEFCIYGINKEIIHIIS